MPRPWLWVRRGSGSITLTETDRGTHRVLHMPVTIVRGQEAVTLTKSCEPTDLSAHGTTSCTVTAANPTFDDVTYSIKDNVPNELKLDRSSVTGGTVKGRDTIVAKGTLPAADPADVQAQFGGFQSPFGYVPLDGFGGTINDRRRRRRDHLQLRRSGVRLRR